MIKVPFLPVGGGWSRGLWETWQRGTVTLVILDVWLRAAASGDGATCARAGLSPVSTLLPAVIKNGRAVRASTTGPAPACHVMFRGFRPNGRCRVGNLQEKKGCCFCPVVVICVAHSKRSRRLRLLAGS